MPSLRRGSNSRIQVEAARAGVTSLPPVLVVPSGSLKLMTYVMLTPFCVRFVTVVRKVVSLVEDGAPQSMGTKEKEESLA